MADAAACMTSSYLRVPGTFDWSDDGRQLTFVGRDITLSRVARIETGQSVRIDYRFETDSLVFFSRITESLRAGGAGSSASHGLFSDSPDATTIAKPCRNPPVFAWP